MTSSKIVVVVHYGIKCAHVILEDLAMPLLLLCGTKWDTVRVGLRRARALGIARVVGNDDVNGLLEDLIDAAHLLAAALHVEGTHLLGNGLALLLSHGREALGLEQVDAGALGAEVGFEADEHEGCVRAEVEDFGVPLWAVSARLAESAGDLWSLPCPLRSRASSDNRWQSRRRGDPFRDMRAGVDGHIPPVQLCPKGRALLFSR